MLNKSSSLVLASLSAAVKREMRVNCRAVAFPAERRVLARQGWAGEKSGLVEHPANDVERVYEVSDSYVSVMLK